MTAGASATPGNQEVAMCEWMNEWRSYESITLLQWGDCTVLMKKWNVFWGFFNRLTKISLAGGYMTETGYISRVQQLLRYLGDLNNLW